MTKKASKKQCEGKIPHTSRRNAEKALYSMNKIGARGLHVYKCKRCQGYHVGHNPYHQRKR